MENQRIVNSTSNKYVKSCFWNMYQSIVYCNLYYGLYRGFYMRILQIIRGVAMVAILAATGVLVAFSNIEIVRYLCPIIIVIAQIVQSVIDKLPIKQRVSDCREACLQYNSLQFDAERFWLQITAHKRSNEEIIKAVSFFGKQMVKIEESFFLEDSLPDSKHIKEKASEECSRYLNARF